MQDKFEIGAIDNVLIFSPLTDYLDASNKDEFRDALDGALKNSISVVVDLSAVRFVDSSGLGVLMSALKRARALGGDIVACGIVKPVKQLFNLVRLDRVMTEFPDRESAVASLRKQ